MKAYALITFYCTIGSPKLELQTSLKILKYLLSYLKYILKVYLYAARKPCSLVVGW